MFHIRLHPLSWRDFLFRWSERKQLEFNLFLFPILQMFNCLFMQDLPSLWWGWFNNILALDWFNEVLYKLRYYSIHGYMVWRHLRMFPKKPFCLMSAGISRQDVFCLKQKISCLLKLEEMRHHDSVK